MSAQAAGDRATRGLGEPVVVRVLVVYVLARVPAAAVWLSIVLDVSRASGSYAAAGSSVAAYGVGVALFAPFVGRAADRWGARAVLLAAAAVQLPALLLLAAAAHRAGAALLLPSFVAGAVQPPLIPCMRAGWALLVQDEAERQACFSFDAVLGEVVDLAAPVIAVGLSVARGRASSLAVVAVTVAVTTLAFAVVAPSARRTAEVGRPRALTRRVLAVLVVVLVLTAGLGAVEVAVVALSDSAGRRFDAGVLLSLFTLGSAAGGVAHGRLRWDASARTQLLLLMVPLGAGLAAAAVLPHRTVLTGVTLTLAGVTVAPLVAVLLGMLQEVAQEGAATETFTYATTANFLGVAAGSVLAGRAGDAAVTGWPGRGAAGLLLAALLVAAALGCALLLRGLLPTRLPADDDEAARGVPAAVAGAPDRAVAASAVQELEQLWQQAREVGARNDALAAELARRRAAR